MTGTAHERESYADGYAEGRRTALHLVVALDDSTVMAAANQALREEWRPRSFRCYWAGMRRGLRNHYDEAWRPNVLAARRRAGII